jgi:MOSC domain-containing protein YiiM
VTGSPDHWWRGTLLHTFLAEAAGVEMLECDGVRLVAGHGVEGDRYANGVGYYSHRPHEDRQVTLIEIETLEALARDHGIDLAPDETRRNLVTRGVPLNHLVGRRFRVGDALLFGGRLNVPCKYLERLLDKPVMEPLINRSGLNCRIITGARVRPGDVIVPE